jgi:Na+/H+ antiporter NhaA
MLNFLKVERNAAALLLLFATLGLVLANTSAAPFIDQLAHTPLDIAPLGIHLYLSAWLGEFFMGGFFLLIGLELKRELHSGAFRDRRALTIPTLAALFGALVPAAIFLGSSQHGCRRRLADSDGYGCDFRTCDFRGLCQSNATFGKNVFALVCRDR